MGSCCQRLSEDTGNLGDKHHWPDGSRSSRLSSDTSTQFSPRVSFSDSIIALDKLDQAEMRLSEETPKDVFSSSHLQVMSFFGPRKGSKTPSSGRSSLASILSVQSAVQLTRMSSLKQEGSNISSDEIRCKKPRRTVSLRLPNKHRRPSECETKVPTIYIGDPQPVRRKSSIQRALSLLSVDSTHAEPKPVQRILRQPRRRRHVRGISGLPIEVPYTTRLQRNQALYYPTHNAQYARRETLAVYS